MGEEGSELEIERRTEEEGAALRVEGAPKKKRRRPFAGEDEASAE